MLWLIVKIEKYENELYCGKVFSESILKTNVSTPNN